MENESKRVYIMNYVVLVKRQKSTNHPIQATMSSSSTTIGRGTVTANPENCQRSGKIISQQNSIRNARSPACVLHSSLGRSSVVEKVWFCKAIQTSCCIAYEIGSPGIHTWGLYLTTRYRGARRCMVDRRTAREFWLMNFSFLSKGCNSEHCLL